MKKILHVFLVLTFVFTLSACKKKVVDPNETVQNGDVVNIDYVGFFNGEQFKGGSAEGYDLRIGSHSFVDDFEEQLIGMKVDQSRTITVTFPVFYPSSPKLAGQDVQFDVTINEIKR